MTGGGRRWALRTLAFALAVGLWFAVSVDDRDAVREKTVEASVTFDKPENLILVESLQTVKVRVRGPAQDVDRLAPYMVQVVVEIPAQGPSVLNLTLSAENVELPSDYDLDVLSLEPNIVRLEVDEKRTRTLPLQPSFTGEPAAGARLLRDRVEIQPQTATITGPASILDGLNVLDLAPINLDGHALTFEETASVIPPQPSVQVLENSRVTVRVPLEVDAPASNSPNTGG